MLNLPVLPPHEAAASLDAENETLIQRCQVCEEGAAARSGLLESGGHIQTMIFTRLSRRGLPSPTSPSG